LITLCDTLHTR